MQYMWFYIFIRNTLKSHVVCATDEIFASSVFINPYYHKGQNAHTDNFDTGNGDSKVRWNTICEVVIGFPLMSGKGESKGPVGQDGKEVQQWKNSSSQYLSKMESLREAEKNGKI